MLELISFGLFIVFLAFITSPKNIVGILDWLAGKEYDWKPLKSVIWIYAFTAMHTLRTMLEPVPLVSAQMTRVALGLGMLAIVLPTAYHLVWLVAEHIDKDNPLPWGSTAWLKEVAHDVNHLIAGLIARAVIKKWGDRK